MTMRIPRAGVSVAELADVMADAGKPISPDAIRYHCRDPRGMLYGRAERVSGGWSIPAADAADFAALPLN